MIRKDYDEEALILVNIRRKPVMDTMHKNYRSVRFNTSSICL